MYKKVIKKLAACMAGVMIVTSMDLSAFAVQDVAEKSADNTGKTVITLGELDDSTAMQYLGIGASEDDIIFPETLEGYLYSDAAGENSTSDGSASSNGNAASNENSANNENASSGASDSGTTGSKTGDTSSGSSNMNDISKETQGSGVSDSGVSDSGAYGTSDENGASYENGTTSGGEESSSRISGTSDGNGTSNGNTTSNGIGASDNVTTDIPIAISVTWGMDKELSGGAEFDSSAAGKQYVYKAEMTQEAQAVYQLADGVALPVIKVTILTDDEMVIHKLQVRIDALPTVEEFKALTGEEVEGSVLNSTQLEVYMEAGTLADEIYELDEEHQAQLDMTKLEELLEYLNSMTEETAVELNALPGARSEQNSAGDVFLGGNYIELGISKGGSFGTSKVPSDFWKYSTRTAKAFHANLYKTYNNAGLGMFADDDGWNIGKSPIAGDFFLPGSQEERWMFSYKMNNTTYTFTIGDRQGLTKSGWKYVPTTTNASNGDNLSAVVAGVTNQNVKIEITYSFGVDDKAYLTDVVITNNGTADISNVYFGRSFDPDMDADLKNNFNTKNKLICNPTSDKKGGSDNYAMVVASGPISGASFFFLSNDNRARVIAGSSSGIIAPTQNLYTLWNNAAKTSKTYAEASDLDLSSVAAVDTYIAITFNIGTIAQGASDSFQYTSSLDADVTSALDKYAPSKTEVDISGLAFTGMTKDSDGSFSGTYDGTAFVPDTSGVTFTSDGGAVTISEPKFTYKYYKKVDGKWVALTEAPTDAGDYKVVATLDDDSYDGEVEVPFTIASKPVTLKNVAAKDKIYDDTTVAEFDISGATIDGLIAGDSVTIDDSSAAGIFADKKVGTGKTVTYAGFGLTGAKASNYTVQSVDSSTAAITRPTITLPADMSGYTLTMDDVSDDDWNGTITLHFSFTTEYGKESESAFGIFANGKRATLSAADGGYTAILSGLYSNQTVTVTGVRDVTHPVVKITVEGQVFDSLKEYFNIKFETYYQTAQQVTVNSTDAGSGVAATMYYVSDKALTENEIKSSSIRWNAYARFFMIQPDSTYVIYARATDNAGNITYVSSDGLVIHATAPVVSGIESGKTYTGTTPFTIVSSYLKSVMIDGEEASPDDNGTYKLVPRKESYTIKVTDEAGNVTELTVTIDWNRVTAPSVSDKVYNGSLQVADISDTDEYYVSSNDGGIDVGDYTAELTLKDTVNDRWADKEGGVAAHTVSYRITKAVPKEEVTAAGNLVYNGMNQALVNASSDGGTLKYSLDGGSTWTDTLPAKRDAGTYTVTYKVEGDNNFVEVAGGSYTVTIARKPVTVSGLTADDKVYDKSTSAVIETTGAVFDGIVSSDTLNVTADGAFAGRDVVTGSDGNAIDQTVTISGITLGGEDAANYELAADGHQTEAQAKIKPREVSVNITPNGGVYGGTIRGAEGSLRGCVSDENPAVTFTYTGTANDGTTADGTIPSHAGTYTATASIDDTNYVLTGTTTAEFVVQKAEANLWVNEINEELTAAEGGYAAFSLLDETKKYVTTDSDGDFGYTSSMENVATVNSDGVVTITESGTTVLTITQEETSNYLAAQKQISIKVGKDGVVFTITTAGYYITYGDEPFTIAASANVGADEITYTSSLPTVAGVDNTGKVTALGLSTAGEGVTYEADGSVKVVITIAVKANEYHEASTTTVDVYVYPKSITVTPDDVSAIYGDAAVTALTYRADGLVGSDTLSGINVSKNNDGTYNSESVSGYNVGTYALTATETAGANPNYKITFKEGSYTITPKTIGITWGTKTFTYDGTEKKPEAAITGLESSDTCTLTVLGGQTDTNAKSGSTVYTATVTGIEGGSASNYVLPSEGLTQSFTIMPKTVGLTWSNTAFEYDGNEKSPAATVTGLVDGDSEICAVTEYAITGANASDNKAVSAGSYTSTATKLDNDNYKLPSYRSTGFTIGRVVSACETAPAAKDRTYDGTTQPLVEGGSATGGTFMYRLGNGAWTSTVPTARKAGTYQVSYKVAGDANHTDTDAATITVTIGKKTVTVSGIKGNPKTYDGTTAVTLDYTGVVINGAVAGDNVTAKAKGVLDNANVGTQAVSLSGITLSGADVGNYELAESGQQASTTAVIAPKEVTVSITANNGIYGSHAAEAGAEVHGYVSGHKPAVTLTYSGTANDGTTLTNSSALPTLAGSYTVTASIADTNYTLTGDKTADFIIDRASPNLSVEAVREKTYGDEQFKLNIAKKDGSGAASFTSTGKVADIDSAGMVTIRNAGTETITVSVAESANYTAQTTTISVVVSQAAGKIAVDKLGYTVTYGDEPFRIAAAAEEDASVSFASNDTSVATVSAEGIVTIQNVGETEITLSTSGSKNFYAAATNVSVKVVPKEVTVTPQDVTITYGDSEVTDLKYAVSGLVGDDTLDGITVTRGQSGVLGTEAMTGEHAGVYALTASEVSGANPNYSITFAEGTYTILQKEISITWSDTVFTYTGKRQCPKATAGALVQGDSCRLTVSGAERNTGTYTATVTALDNSNYKLPQNTSVSFVIQQKAVVVTVEDAGRHVSDTKDPKFYYNTSGLPDGQTLIGITITREAGIAAGTYRMTATQAAGANADYTITFVDGTFTIKDHKPVAVASKPAVSATCTGTGLTQEIICAVDGCGIIIEMQEVTEPLGHDWSGEWTTVKAATATTEGRKEMYCARDCGQKQVEVIPCIGQEEDPSVGALEKAAEVSADAPIREAVFANSKTELLDKLFTAEQKVKIARGVSAKVWLEISKTDEESLDEADKAEFLQKALEITGSSDKITYFDLDLFKKFGSDAKVQLFEPGMSIRVQILIPEELRNTASGYKRQYSIIRLHIDQDTDEHQITVISDTTYDEATGELSFETDKFSTCAIVYTDTKVEVPTKGGGFYGIPMINQTTAQTTIAVDPTEPDNTSDSKKSAATGDHNRVILWMALLVLSGSVSVSVARKKRRGY